MAEDERAINTKREQFHVQMCNRVNELDASVQADRESLLTWIKNDSENFTRLKYPSRQYFPEICKIFVCSRLTKTDDSSGKNRFCYSLDFHPCIKLEYTTYKSEEIEYYDTELGIVTYLESQFAIVFKIMDCLKLLKALDINAADISIGCVYEKLRTIALQAWREVVMSIVENDKIGFYHFAQNFSVIAAKFAAVINAKLEAYGVTASNITISKMTIPESVREQIRQHSYENKCENDRYTAEVKFAGMYLEHYRKKAEIQSTYGTAETLTEFEKDRALERYLVRVNNERKTVVEEAPLEERDESYGLDVPVAPKAPTIEKPQEPSLKAKNNSLVIGAVVGGGLLVLGSILRALVPEIAALGTTLLVIGIITFAACAAFLIWRIVKFKKESATLLEEYQKQLKLYEDAQKQYNIDMESYKKAYAKYKANLSAKSKN